MTATLVTTNLAGGFAHRTLFERLDVTVAPGDVIGVHVRHHHQLEPAATRGELLQALFELRGRRGPRVNQNHMGRGFFAVLDPHPVFLSKDPYWAPQVERQAAEYGFRADDKGKMIKPDNYAALREEMSQRKQPDRIVRFPRDRLLEALDRALGP